MQEKYNGFSAWLSIVPIPNASMVLGTCWIFYWCIQQALQLQIHYISVYWMKLCYCFISHTWENADKDIHHRRLNTTGETHWWSKAAAVRKEWGLCFNLEPSLYIEVTATLEHDESNRKLESEACVQVTSIYIIATEIWDCPNSLNCSVKILTDIILIKFFSNKQYRFLSFVYCRLKHWILYGQKGKQYPSNLNTLMTKWENTVPQRHIIFKMLHLYNYTPFSAIFV